MSTQQDIYAAGSESRPPMLNKENYVPWSSRLLWYAKSRPNGKLIHNSILNGPYVRKMIPEPGDANRDITVTETFNLQTDDELSDKELKQIEADDQAIQTILFGLSEDIYAAVDKVTPSSYGFVWSNENHNHKWALCYPKNDREDIRKLGAKGDIGFFIGYYADSYAYKVYNQRIKKIMETMNVTFDELLAMAFEQSSLKLGLQSMTSGQ
nr:Gag-Pol polyprotein [Tanacetum cinerariifolium]